MPCTFPHITAEKQPHSSTAVKSYRLFVFLKGLLHSREEGKNGSGDKQKKKRVSQFYKKDLKPELGHIYFLFLSLFFLQGPYSLWNLSFPTRN